MIVQDTGSGIAHDELANIFKPFEQSSSGIKQGGTGLGLSIVRALVQDHGGSIVAENAPEGGAVIRMEFPLV